MRINYIEGGIRSYIFIRYDGGHQQDGWTWIMDGYVWRPRKRNSRIIVGLRH